MARCISITRLFALVCLLLITAASRASAQDIVLDGSEVNEVLAYGTVVAGDPIDPTPDRPDTYYTDLSLDDARAAISQSGIQAVGPVGGPQPWSGPIWVQITLVNHGEEDLLYRLWPEGFAAQFDLDAWLIPTDEKEPRLIWRQAAFDEGFSARRPHTRLAMSESFVIPAETQVEIWFHFPRGFITDTPMLLTEEQAYVEELVSTEGFHTFLFGARAMLLVGIFAFAAILRLKTAFYYGLFALFIYLYFMSTYGYAFASVFRNLQLNYGVGVLMGGLAMTAFTLMTRTFLNARAVYPIFNRVLIGSLSLCWIIGLIAGFIMPVQWAQLTLFPAILLAASVNFAGAILALVNKHRGSVLYFVAAVFLLSLSIFGVAVSETELMSYRAWSMIVHVGFTLDTVLFAAALVTQAMALRRERDDSVGAELAALRDKADLTTRLSTAEAAHASALALAEHQRRRAVSTAHDLRQPLLSLRMALAKGEQEETLGQGLSYLESVIERDLIEARPANPSPPPGETPKEIPAAKLIDSVTMMFGDEAALKSIRLAGEPSSLLIKGDPVILMRLLTNLVANAVKHTGEGTVTVSACEDQGTASLKVTDTGPGIPDGALPALFMPYVKSDQSPGEGLGLSVVQTLAEEHGWSIGVRSEEGTGSTFSIDGIEIVKPVV